MSITETDISEDGAPGIPDRATALPATASLTYLNTGSAGPLLADSAAAMTSALNHELLNGRADEASWQAFLASRINLRAALADLVGADTDEITLTHHTTEGLNLVLWGLDLGPGDRVVMSSLEHDAGIAAVQIAAARRGFTVVIAECEAGSPDEVLAGFDAVFADGQVALAVLSHVAWSTGAVLPIAGVTELAHRAGALVLVDGAQAVGAVTVDVAAAGVDFYAFNGYKWLCGPEGSGALVVARRHHERLLPSFGGAFGVVGGSLSLRDTSALLPAEGAARYESGSWFRPQLPGLLVAADWFRGLVSAGGGPAHVSAIADECVARLLEIGATIVTPLTEGPSSGLVAFNLPRSDPAVVVASLAARGTVIRRIPGTENLRASCAAFTTSRDVDTLVRELILLSG